MAPSHARASATVLALATVLLLAGCSGLPEETVAGGAGGAGGAGSTEDGSDSTETDATEADSDAGDDAGAKLEGEECLPGNWFLDNEQFGALISATSDGVVDDVTGTVMLTFTADGTTTTAYENWGHTITADGATATIVKNGTDSGTYSVGSDGSMSLIDVNISSTTSMTMDINGQKVTNQVTAEPSVFSQASFVCSGDNLTVTADGATTVMYREH